MELTSAKPVEDVPSIFDSGTEASRRVVVRPSKKKIEPLIPESDALS